jgi:predicted 3-demethylubiquinone-9 3-methyltransferase (glyoxalase superfamily)
MTVQFELGNREFTALNGGPGFTFNEAISFMVPCTSQSEVDRYWDSLSDGGEESQCGWLKDRFGVSWQIIPDRLGELLGGSDPEGAQRAMQAMLGMQKLDIAVLEKAYEGT